MQLHDQILVTLEYCPFNELKPVVDIQSLIMQYMFGMMLESSCHHNILFPQLSTN